MRRLGSVIAVVGVLFVVAGFAGQDDISHIKRILSLITAASGADPAADYVLTWQGSNQIEWKDSPSTLSLDKARVYNSGNVSVPNATTTWVTFALENFDVGGLHSTVSNTSRLTAPVDGYYVIGFHLQWDANATGVRWGRISINRSSGVVYDQDSAATASYSVSEGTGIYYMTSGQFAEVSCYQNSGGALNILPGDSGFWMFRIG